MKLFYVLAILPLLAAAAPVPAPKPSGYPYGKRADEPALAKRQATVADLKRRADAVDNHKKPGKPSGYYPR
jgi:hypothetical protein